jgi:hypothetical protein
MSNRSDVEPAESAVISGGISAGPFINPLPTPPGDWTAYLYATVAGGSFKITSGSALDGANVTIP